VLARGYWALAAAAAWASRGSWSPHPCPDLPCPVRCGPCCLAAPAPARTACPCSCCGCACCAPCCGCAWLGLCCGCVGPCGRDCGCACCSCHGCGCAACPAVNGLSPCLCPCPHACCGLCLCPCRPLRCQASLGPCHLPPCLPQRCWVSAVQHPRLRAPPAPAAAAAAPCVHHLAASCPAAAACEARHLLQGTLVSGCACGRCQVLVGPRERQLGHLRWQLQQLRRQQQPAVPRCMQSVCVHRHEGLHDRNGSMAGT
jgi:hypothetical protein